MLPDISEEHLHFWEMLLLQELTPQRFRMMPAGKNMSFAHGMTYLDLSTIPRYMDCFTGGLSFIPHTTVGRTPRYRGNTRYFASSGTDPGTGVTRYFTSSGTVPTIPG